MVMVQKRELLRRSRHRRLRENEDCRSAWLAERGKGYAVSRQPLGDIENPRFAVLQPTHFNLFNVLTVSDVHTHVLQAGSLILNRDNALVRRNMFQRKWYRLAFHALRIEHSWVDNRGVPRNVRELKLDI